MAGTVAEIKHAFGEYRDPPAAKIGALWSSWADQRNVKVSEWLELRNYLFATDTSSTSNQTNPWKNSTTTPKLCQIRDNLHSNYISALFPNDRWFSWEGYSEKDDSREKVAAITAYMSNKMIESGFRDVTSSLLYDYIDFGNAFGMTTYEDNSFTNDEGEVVTGYVGPRIVRINPLDIVFNPIAVSFEKSPKIIRKIYTIGEFAKLAKQDRDWKAAFTKSHKIRSLCNAYPAKAFNEAVGYMVDGFGDISTYFGSDYVEVLTFYGDYYDGETDTLHEDAEVVIIDRAITVKIGKIKSWTGKSNIAHVSWRKRPDNLYGMGPLDNLVGMQYRVDHLENLKADAQDLAVHPMLKIIGDVDQFDYMPGGEIYIQGDGDVVEMGNNLSGVISANNEIDILLARMEEMAGAPKQAMGIRTPGEKTAFEVQSLDNAAGRIFQEKVTNFEINMIEVLMNNMLADARQNLDGVDVARVIDNDLGVTDFLEITRDDITARGTLRPIGARHFAQQAQLIQNLNQLASGGILPLIQAHISGEALARVVEDALQLGRFGVIRTNAAIGEAIKTQQLAAAAQEQAQVEQSTPTPGMGNVQQTNQP